RVTVKNCFFHDLIFPIPERLIFLPCFRLALELYPPGKMFHISCFSVEWVSCLAVHVPKRSIDKKGEIRGAPYQNFLMLPDHRMLNFPCYLDRIFLHET